MNGITAVILAAGMGIRMGPRGRLMPKGLLRLGAATLIEESVATLRAWGAARIVIVTGHLSEQYEAVFAGNDVELVYNALYATTGSLRSLWLGLGVARGPVVVVESDLTYAPEALRPIRPDRNRVTLSSPTGSGDEQYVWVREAPDGGRLFDAISKNPVARREAHFGEHVGITGFTEATAVRLLDLAEETLAREPDAHYEPTLAALGQEAEMECVLVDGLAWAEIDDEAMFARALAQVYPQVRMRRCAAEV